MARSLMILWAAAALGCADGASLPPPVGPTDATAPIADVGAEAGADAGRSDGSPLSPEAGRDTGPPGGSGLDRSRRVATLGDAELGRLCDWGVGLLGGYGTVAFCSDGTQLRNSPSQRACIAGHDRSAACIATVGDSEDCLRSLANGGCSQAVLSGTPACRAMATCQRP